MIPFRRVDSRPRSRERAKMRAMTHKANLLRASTCLLLACAIAACAMPKPPSQPQSHAASPTAARQEVDLPTSAVQGSLVTGRAVGALSIEFAGHAVSVASDGRFVIGIARDARGMMPVRVTFANGATRVVDVAATARDWPIERINGVPPATVNPPPAIAARIAAEQARVAAVRQRDDARDDYLAPFIWPVQGRVSGRFGNQRIYNGSEGTPHSGMDIAASQGTPVRAPAAGVVSFADPDLYLTGGTVVLDHGRGVSSNFLHLSRIDVRVGDRVEQGSVIGAVGATGRATGPHLHWGMNWFDVRVDPLLVLERR
jgi:murein DD-endopeptidase MepM/ murein hydrolase activator NlpD